MLSNDKIRRFQQLVDGCFAEYVASDLGLQTVIAAVHTAKKYIDNAASNINVICFSSSMTETFMIFVGVHAHQEPKYRRILHTAKAWVDHMSPCPEAVKLLNIAGFKEGISHHINDTAGNLCEHVLIHSNVAILVLVSQVNNGGFYVWLRRLYCVGVCSEFRIFWQLFNHNGRIGHHLETRKPMFL